MVNSELYTRVKVACWEICYWNPLVDPAVRNKCSWRSGVSGTNTPRMSRVFSSEPDHKDKMWGENIEQPAEPGGRCELHSDDKVLHLA